MTTTSDNMGLVLATVSETLGPEWASLLNTLILRVDEHDHTDGNGVLVTPAGMSINDDLSFDGHAIEDALAVQFEAQASAVDTDRAGSLQMLGDDLYWVSGAGASVRLTAGSNPVTPGTGELSTSTPGAYPYDVTTADSQKVLLVDTSAARTINLPAATDAMYFIVKDASGQAFTNNITINRDGTDTIDGATSITVDANYMTLALISDGVSSWYVV